MDVLLALWMGCLLLFNNSRCRYVALNARRAACRFAGSGMTLLCLLSIARRWRWQQLPLPRAIAACQDRHRHLA